MKIKNIACIASLLLVSLSVVKAATTLTAWNFDNVAIGASGSPSPSTGLGTASALGLGNSYNNTNSISNPDVQSLAGSSSGGANSWRIRGSGAAPFGGNGWSTNAPLGTQGAQFSGSTFGYYKVKVTFDVYATTNAEANLQLQYTTDGSGTNWFNANITSGGTSAVVKTNTDPTQGTVLGTYVKLTNGWNNQITVDFSGISGVDNNANFAIRLVNASTGTNCVDTTGAVYNNTSGSWTFDNVVIQGATIDTIVDWTFESEPNNGTIITNPVPEIGSGTATSIGFNNTYTYAGSSTPGSTNGPDVINTGGSSSGTAGPNAWRVRGNPGNNGWNSAAPIGTQGAEYDVSTAGYSNIVVFFDLYSTSQGEAKMCVLYTTNGWTTTNVANTLFYEANPAFVVTNLPVNLGGSANTVTGTYFYQTTGQNFYNNITVDLTGVPGVDNNPNFAFRVVNAATGSDCVAFNGGPYNNSSGNWRYDNVTVGGTSGTPAPTLAYDPNATVDHPFTNTFTDDPVWRSKIAAINVNGSALTNTAYTTNTPGMIIFTPSKSTLLQSSGLKNIVIIAAGYGTAKVAQPLGAGVATQLSITTQPAAPSASGGTLTANPVLAITDQYGNGTTNPYANVTFTANVNNSSWILGGNTVQSAISGIAVFTNLTATATNGTGTVSNYLTFTVTGYAPLTITNSAYFNIGAAPARFTPGNLAVIQLDTVANNTTFSILEIKPSAANQTNAVNIVPISATGTNALRLSSAGSCGKLSLSDDGTLVCFAAFADNSAATPDETLNLNRAAAGLNYTNGLTMGLSYISTSLGGSQARSCATLDNVNWIADDKGGLYEGSLAGGTLANPNLNPYNNVVVRTFGGVPYVETQKTANGQVLPVVYALGLDPDTGLYDVTKANNLTTDPNAGDFYLISTNGGTTFDILYVLDQNSSTQGVIKKYSWVNSAWAANGSFTNGNGGDSLFATTNGNGGVYLYYTTGASTKNQIVQVTDSAGWNASMNIISSNVIYSASGNTYVKGLTFVPQKAAYAAELVPPPILAAQTGATVGSPFTVTNTPDDPTWRSAITSITVNGSILPTAAYNKTQSGKIIFDPSQSALLQTNGLKTIVISATGYSTNAITQNLAASAATKLAVTTQPAAPTANGGILVTQPVVKVEDLYGNVVTNSSASIVATVGAGAWTIGGNATNNAVLGTATFTNLTATSTAAVTGATISFNSAGLAGATSSGFNIVAPASYPPNLGGVTLSGGKLTFSFTNVTGLSFSVLATNNVTAPLTNWPVIGTATESPSGSGNYQFTNSAPATNGSLFFILRQP
jgi:heme-binding protein Shr